MKVAIVTRYFPPRTDAIGDYANHLAYALAQSGIETILVTSAGGVTSPENAFISVKPVIRNWGWGGIGAIIATIRNLAADAVNLQYVPHLYGRYGMNLAMAALPLFLRVGIKKPVITTCHELLSHKPSGLKGWLLQIIYLLQVWLILLGSSKVIVPAVWQEKQIQCYFRRLSRKVCRIPVGTNIPVVTVEKAPGPSRPIKDREHPLTLGTFGTGHPWWQYEMAMEILKGLQNRGIQIRLLCIGNIEGSNPKYYRRLRQLETVLGLAGSIEWTGRCSPEEVSQHLQSIDIFLALQETGITARNSSLVAALAHGLPIIATRGPDADEWLLNSSALCVVDSKNPSEAIEVAARLAVHPPERKELHQRALDFYHYYFSWERIRDQFLETIASVQPIRSTASC